LPKEFTLDELVREPSRAAELAAPVRQQLALRCAAVLVALAAVPIEDAPAGNDRLIDLDEASRILGISPATLRKKRLPFRVKVGGSARFSRAGIERYIRARQGR